MSDELAAFAAWVRRQGWPAHIVRMLVTDVHVRQANGKPAPNRERVARMVARWLIEENLLAVAVRYVDHGGGKLEASPDFSDPVRIEGCVCHKRLWWPERHLSPVGRCPIGRM